MYIKIKHLKYAALSLACVFFASHAYSTYVKADDVQVNSYTTADPSQTLTTQFAQELKSFVASKGNQSISTTELNDFVNTNMSAKLGDPITEETLPELDTSKIKVLDQSYSSMSKEERTKQLQADADKYFEQLLYTIISNIPKILLTQDDFNSFGQEFMLNFYSLSTANPNYEYFRELGIRLDQIISQSYSIEVPETILPIHTKMLRIAKGFLSLSSADTVNNDPLTKMILLSKIRDLTNISTSFIQTDLYNYLNNF